MSELLIVAASPADLAQLEQLAQSRNITFKSALDIDSAIAWLKRRTFSIAFVDSDLAIVNQQKIADGLWKVNPAASYLIYNFHKEPDSKRQELRLFGAEVAMGKNARSVLEKALIDNQERPAIDQDKFSILVVEDLDSPRDIICFYLESLGYKSVTGKNSAKEAMTELENNPGKYSCVITDIRMPNITGTELTSFIRSHPRLNHLPIVILTAYGSADTLVECLKAGASGFLVKPPRKDDLMRELNRAHRIVRGEISPRLARGNEVDDIREILIEKGLS